MKTHRPLMLAFRDDETGGNRRRFKKRNHSLSPAHFYSATKLEHNRREQVERVKGGENSQTSCSLRQQRPGRPAGLP